MDQPISLVQLHWLDWVVVAIYGVITFGIAYWAMRLVKNTGGLLVGKCKAGKWMMMASGFAGGTNIESSHRNRCRNLSARYSGDVVDLLRLPKLLKNGEASLADYKRTLSESVSVFSL